jgi:hypothetical protein
MKSIVLSPIYPSSCLDYCIIRNNNNNTGIFDKLKDKYKNEICFVNATRVISPRVLVAGVLKAITYRIPNGNIEPVDLWMSQHIEKANQFYDASKANFILIAKIRNINESNHEIFDNDELKSATVQNMEEIILEMDLLRKTFDLTVVEDLEHGIVTRIALARV